MPNRPNIRQMLMPAADTLALRKRAMESQEKAELLNNPQALEYFKQQGASPEKIDQMRQMLSKQATAQADSLAQMRAEMRQASTERARQAFGGEAVDRAARAGFNVIAEEPTDDGKSAYTWERRIPEDKPVPQYDSRRMTYQSATDAPDEEMLKQQAFMRMRASGRLDPQAYADSMQASRTRRRKP